MVHIKKVVIQGFKSYKELLDLEPFSKGSNVIVGRNGSGKSNFFFAIRFVLSDLFSNLRADERQALLHEGAGSNVMSAYVEIHFDNADRRFPIDRDEVVLRRQIGLKKDEYSLDKKHVSKQDVVNLLESAGFSRSNPYYIVQQGKVNALTMMKDSERLELLKEVAGTRVYDERRDESLKIMKEAAGRREKIEEMLRYIETRLKELEDEKEELKAYQELDRERRALEYTLYTKELQSTNETLRRLDTDRQEESSRAKEEYQNALLVHKALKAKERELKDAEIEMRRLNKEKSVIEEERKELLKQKAKLELELEEAESRAGTDQENQERLAKEAERLRKEIRTTTKKLDDLTPRYMAAVEAERDVNERIIDCERRVNDLYSKQGRSSRFTNKKERDAWIKKEIKLVDRTIEVQKQQIEALQDEINQIGAMREDEAKKVTQTQAKLEEIRKLIERNNQALSELKNRRDESSNRRKELWREDTENDSAIQSYKAELAKAERVLNSTVNKVTAAGIASISRLAEEHRVRGVYGPLIELFQCPEAMSTAVEVTAGGSLFHVVVASDDVASQLIELMHQEGSSARVTFMPLNRIRTEDTHMPSTEEARPLLAQLTYNPMFLPAMKLVFSKTLLCKSLDVANDMSQTHNVNCVTIEGDQVNRKGALTGGFIDVRTSRIEAMRTILTIRDKLKELTAKAEKLKAAIQEADQQVTGALGEMQKLEVRGAKHHDTYEQLSMDLRLLIKDEQANRATVEHKEIMLAELTVSLRQLEETRKSLQGELGTEIQDHLPPDQQKLLKDLIDEITAKKEELIQCTAARAELEGQRTVLQNLLQHNLAKREAEIAEELDALSLAQQPENVRLMQQELSRTNAAIQGTARRLKEIENQVEEKNTVRNQVQKEIEEMKDTESRHAREIQTESKRMERLLNKRSLLLQKQEECTQKIRELGSLPANVEKYKDMVKKELLDQLDKVNRELQGYSQVNKKALDQYVSFTEQYDDLLNKKKESDSGADRITELIQALDRKKDEAIERTFKGVAKHFAQVFSELVPDGKGVLVMQRSKDVQEVGRIAAYTGVAIKVAFTRGGETQHMQHLSGGQKSLVALALIFAIQRCDPAPFYLFDEIDSALDQSHRTAVAEMIKRQAEKAQFITTTFRPELVRSAKKHYGITFKNKISSIHAITEKKALAIIRASAEAEAGPLMPAEEEEEEEEETSKGKEPAASTTTTRYEGEEGEEEETQLGEGEGEGEGEEGAAPMEE